MSVREQNARTQEAMRGRAAEKRAKQPECCSRLGNIRCQKVLRHSGLHENDMGESWRPIEADRD